MIVALIALGLVIGLGTLAAILWSIYRPSKRIWPPQSYNAFTPVLVWTPTFLLFGVIVGLGVLQWGQLGWPSWLHIPRHSTTDSDDMRPVIPGYPTTLV